MCCIATKRDSAKPSWLHWLHANPFLSEMHLVNTLIRMKEEHIRAETLWRSSTFQAWRTQNVSRQLGSGKRVETCTPLERTEVALLSSVVLPEASRQSALRGEGTRMNDASPCRQFIISFSEFNPIYHCATGVPQVCLCCGVVTKICLSVWTSACTCSLIQTTCNLNKRTQSVSLNAERNTCQSKLGFYPITELSHESCFSWLEV